MIHYLEQLNSKLTESKNDKIDLFSANKLFLHASFPVYHSYINASEDVFNATYKPVKFGDSKKALKHINKCVDETTRNKITELFKELDPATVLVVANAIYFKVEQFC